MICARLIIGQRKVDGFQHVIYLTVYLLIPEPDGSVAPLVEVGSASSIFGLFGRLGMLTPVNFDDPAVGDTTEVNEVRTDAGWRRNLKALKLVSRGNQSRT